MTSTDNENKSQESGSLEDFDFSSFNKASKSRGWKSGTIAVLHRIARNLEKSNLWRHKYLIVAAVALLGAAFYWYSYRPVQIREWCHRNVVARFHTQAGSSYEYLYKSCLHSKGI